MKKLMLLIVLCLALAIPLLAGDGQIPTTKSGCPAGQTCLVSPAPTDTLTKAARFVLDTLKLFGLA